MFDFDKLAENMGGLDEARVLAEIRRIVDSEPESAYSAIEALSRGMDIVGDKFEIFEYFVGDLIFAGEVFAEAVGILRAALPDIPAKKNGKKVVLATVEGDLHDIGKNIVRIVLESKGMEVFDLGVNVSPAAIVQKVIEEDAHIVALSGVLTFALESMGRTVAALGAAGIREKVTVVVGGSCINEVAAKKIKADAYAKTPEDTAAICMAVK